MIRAALVAAVAFAAIPALADDPRPVAQTAPAESAPVPSTAPASSPVDAAVAFMTGLTHCSRSGAAGAQGWAQAAANASDKVTMKVAGKDVPLDLANKKAGAKVVKFAKAGTVREGATVKAVTFDTVQVDDHTGKGTLAVEQKDGKWQVTSLEVE